MFKNEMRDKIAWLEDRVATMQHNRSMERLEYCNLAHDFKRLLDYLNIEIVDTPAQRTVRPKEGGKDE